MGKVQKLADYFNIGKYDLIDKKTSVATTSPPDAFTLNTLEKIIITKYRRADEISKAMVLRALSIDENADTKGEAAKMA